MTKPYKFLTMKILLAFLVGLLLTTQVNAQTAGVPAPTNIPGQKYPQLLPDNRVMFRVKAPDAQKVQMDLGRKYDMVKDTSGFWTVTTDPIPEGFHYYSLIVDGVALCDPASQTFYGMGRMASGIDIPDKDMDYFQP